MNAEEKQKIADENREWWQHQWELNAEDIEACLVLAQVFAEQSGLTRAEVVSVIYDKDNFI